MAEKRHSKVSTAVDVARAGSEYYRLGRHAKGRFDELKGAADEEARLEQERFDREAAEMDAHSDDEAEHPLGDQETAAYGARDGAGNPGSLTPEQILERERADPGGTRTFENPTQARHWYRAGRKAAKEAVKEGIRGRVRGFVRKQKKALITTVVLNVVVAVILALMAFISPLKNVHFETTMRSVNFARFQLVIKKQFARVVFESAVLTQNSVGTFTRSPLVRQIQLATPDRQIKQLGRQGRVKWEFRPNASFGQQVLPLQESLQAVVIDGERVDIDDMSRTTFDGRPYSSLTRKERWVVQARFVDKVNVKLGDIMGVLPRHVRWNPMFQLRQKTGAVLSKWLNKAKEYSGKSEEEARKLSIEEAAEQIGTPEGQRPKSSSSEINDAADATHDEQIAARIEGRPPGEVRSALANRMKIAGRASDIVFASTVVCIGADLAKFFAGTNGARAAQAVRFATAGLASLSQQQIGDTVAEAVGAANSDWDASGSIPDASKSVIYLEMTNQFVNPSSQEYKDQINKVPVLEYTDMFIAMSQGVAGFLDNEALAEGCGFVLAPGTQYTISGLELILVGISLGSVKGFTAGAKALGEIGFHGAVGYGLAELVDWLIGTAVRAYAGTDFFLEQGSDRVGATHVSDKSLAEYSNRTATMGRPLDRPEATSADAIAMAELHKENRESSFGHRYFAIDNPFSLTGRLVARLPASTGGLASTLRSGVAFLGSILSSPFRLVGSISNSGVFGHASAADTSFLDTNFGVDEWGWSPEELKRIETDESFSLGKLVERVEPRMAELDARYGKCYDISTFALQSDRPDECTRTMLSEDDALYWRYYKAMMFSAEHMTGSV